MATQDSKSKEPETTIVNDIVHGIIKLPHYIQEIIDTVQFQRLRHIRQLGFVYFVYPTAGYSRFEHSIGTFHLASELIRQLQNQAKKEKIIEISDDDVKCVEIAALCHDLGHGPYSHVWEHAFDDISILKRRHEDLSVDIFSMLVNSKKSGEDLEIKTKIGLSDDMIKLIGNIILGESDQEKDQKRMFLFEIVANKRSGVDVDKFDYLCRDSIYFGWSNKSKIHDIKRVLHFLRIAQDKENVWHLAMRDREIFHLHDVFYYRHLLHRYGYQHKTVKAIECMFRRALSDIINKEESRDELIKAVCGPEANNKPDIWFSKEFISKVCDYHIWNIMGKYASEFVGKIQERKLYKIFAQIQMTLKDPSQGKEVVHQDIHEFESKLKDAFPELLVTFAISLFALQSENKGNPLISVNFYTKLDPGICFKYKEESLPDLVKLKRDEMVLMIFTETIPEGETEKELEMTKTNLCKETNETLHGSKLVKEIEGLRTKYAFKERLY